MVASATSWAIFEMATLIIPGLCACPGPVTSRVQVTAWRGVCDEVGSPGTAAGARVASKIRLKAKVHVRQRFAEFSQRKAPAQQVLVKIYCRKNGAKIDSIKMLARKYLI